MTIADAFKGAKTTKIQNIIKKTSVDETKHKQKIAEYILTIEPDFEFTDSIKKVYDAIFCYLTGTSDTFSPNKGIWLAGSSGAGKSFLIDIFKAYTSEILKTNSFLMFRFKDILSDYEKIGTHTLDRLCFSNIFSQKPNTIYIDDFMCSQGVVSHYSNIENLPEKITDMRYEIFKKHRKIWHVTSNVFPDQTDLDERAVGRLNEMFNFIEMNGTNHRLKD